MNRKHLISILRGMTVEQLVKFHNDNYDPYSGIWMPKIYDLTEKDDWAEIVEELTKHLDDLCQVKHFLNQINDADRYVNLCEGTVVSWNTLEEMYERFCNTEQLADAYENYEYDEMNWPE